MALRFFTQKHEPIPDFRAGMVMLVDKPTGWTSFDVVNKLRYRLSKITGVKRFKVGHAGTLDPLATGLLIICVGKYTKRIDEYQGMPKQYSGTITFGATTPSYDAETDIDQRFAHDHITEEKVKDVATSFVGQIAQKPPLFSAIKSGGERLYKKARRGEDFEVKARDVTVHGLEISNFENYVASFVLDCSKGFYVRSLAFDMGAALDSGGYLSLLRREKIGAFTVDDAWSLEELVDELDKIVEKVELNVSRDTESK